MNIDRALHQGFYKENFAYDGLYPYIFNRICMFSSNEIKVH